jgi:hypothetical protein
VGNLKQRAPIPSRSSNFKGETQHYVVKLPKSAGARQYCPKTLWMPGTLGTRANSSPSYVLSFPPSSCSLKSKYRISSYSFSGNYSFLDLKIVANSNSCRNISIFYLINRIFAAEPIQGRKLFKETGWRIVCLNIL